MSNTKNNMAIAVASFFILSCSYMSPIGMVSIPAKNKDFSESVKCSENSINELSKKQGNWASKVTLADYKKHIFETGDFPVENKIGLRVQIKMEKDIIIKVKGYGPYYSDLGAQNAASDLKSKISICLNGEIGVN